MQTTNRTKRFGVTFITTLMVLVLSMVSTAMPSAASSTFRARFIDSRGRRISSVYQGLGPNPWFAKQLYLTAKADE
jgi:hypothetical protein